MQSYMKTIVTLVVVVAAGVMVALKYRDYLSNPWTRDGQVRANVIQVASRVSGPIVELPIVDNQFVSAGDLLFKIDPRTYQADYDRAVAALDETLMTTAVSAPPAIRPLEIRTPVFSAFLLVSSSARSLSCPCC